MGRGTFGPVEPKRAHELFLAFALAVDKPFLTKKIALGGDNDGQGESEYSGDENFSQHLE